ncbi:MAG: tripeptidyl-peptidase Serine peptidase family, partial [Jatrophihabitantaceae bacterium]|nr:tripeptidyl-peptidase Serine peptidase family [Jatrophihabitantaceae bacterium]
TLLRLSDAYASRTDDGRYADNRMEAIYDINGLDDPSAIPPSEVSAHFAAFQRASPTFGRVFAWGLASCFGFPVRATERLGEVRAAGAPPIVVIGTVHDPATPYAGAQHLADQLTVGVLLTWDGEGHTAYPKTSCIQEIVDGYLVTGIPPASGTECPAS